jgi:hypothetical protein
MNPSAGAGTFIPESTKQCLARLERAVKATEAASARACKSIEETLANGGLRVIVASLRGTTADPQTIDK